LGGREADGDVDELVAEMGSREQDGAEECVVVEGKYETMRHQIK